MRVWNWPVLPVMPCVMTFVLLSTRMLMRSGASIVVPAKAGTECRYVRRPRAGGDPVSLRFVVPRAGGDPVSLRFVVPAQAGTQCRCVSSSPRRRGPSVVAFRRPRAGADPVSLPGDFAVQIVPIRIRFLDQSNLPCTTPLLDLLLTRERRLGAVVLLKPYQRFDAVVHGETGYPTFLVLPHALDKIRRDANIQRAIPPT